MRNRLFLDTNVLVYPADRDAGKRRQTALDLVREAVASRMGVLSTQVLTEYYTVVTRKLGMDAADARRSVEIYGRLTVARIDVAAILGAIDLSRQERLSFWDSLIVTCAALARCPVLLTEDLQHGRTIAGVRIRNPFRA